MPDATAPKPADSKAAPETISPNPQSVVAAQLPPEASTPEPVVVPGAKTDAEAAIEAQGNAPEQKAAEAATVRMIFPHPILLTVRPSKQIQFLKGEQDVPAEYANHPYLLGQGVKPVVAGDEKIA